MKTKGKNKEDEMKQNYISKKYYDDYVIVSLNKKALQLNSKTRMKWLIESLFRFQYSLNLLYSWRICYLVSME